MSLINQIKGLSVQEFIDKFSKEFGFDSWPSYWSTKGKEALKITYLTLYNSL